MKSKSKQDIKLNVKGEANPKCGKCQLRFPPTQCPEVRPRFANISFDISGRAGREKCSNTEIPINTKFEDIVHLILLIGQVHMPGIGAAAVCGQGYPLQLHHQSDRLSHGVRG